MFQCEIKYLQQDFNELDLGKFYGKLKIPSVSNYCGRLPHNACGLGRVSPQTGTPQNTDIVYGTYLVCFGNTNLLMLLVHRFSKKKAFFKHFSFAFNLA